MTIKPDCGGFIWYELLTTDAAGAKQFYEEVIGWSISPGDKPPLFYGHIGRSDGGSLGGILPITDQMVQQGCIPVWLGYLKVADVEVACTAIAADGGQVLMPKTTIDEGAFAMISDPQGVPFYIMTPNPPPGMPDAKSDVFSEDKPQHMRWNELRTGNPDAAVAFYTKHFGWEQPNEMDLGEMGKYRFIHHDGLQIGAIMDKPPTLPISSWAHYIGVDDIDRAMAAVATKGGAILAGPFPVPGGEFSCLGIDPQGAHFGLIGPRHS